LSGLPALDYLKFAPTIQGRVSRPCKGKCGLYEAGNGHKVKLCDTDCDYGRHNPNCYHWHHWFPPLQFSRQSKW